MMTPEAAREKAARALYGEVGGPTMPVDAIAAALLAMWNEAVEASGKAVCYGCRVKLPFNERGDHVENVIPAALTYTCEAKNIRTLRVDVP